MSRYSHKTLLIRSITAVVIFAVIIAATLYFLNENETSQSSDRSVMEEGFGQLKTVTVDGVQYQEKPAVTTILVYGVDKGEESPLDTTGTETNNGYRNGGQADFLLLLAIDHNNKEVRQLQIDRDTMTDVQILGVFGNEVGTRILQICLAHYFGATPKDNAQYTVKAVENFLGGQQIDGYYGVKYNAIPVFNDMLGGVTVTIPDDMTGADATWTKGTQVLLKGKNAELFVRSRMNVGDGTNASRSIRQKIYMESAIKQLKSKLKEDLSFANDFLNTLKPLATTNMNDNWLISELSKATSYRILAAETPEGEYCIGSDGFVEFHADADSVTNWVLKNLYRKQ